MKRTLLLLTIVALGSALCGPALAQTTAAQPATVHGPRPTDVSSADAILDAAYDSISGEGGAARDWERFRALFIPGARFITATPDEHGDSTARVLDTDAFETSFADYVKTSGFYERDIARRSERYGNIEQVFSTYESRHAASDPKPFARGINSFQLMFDGKRWWIVTIYWQQETPKFPIPAKYLKNG